MERSDGTGSTSAPGDTVGVAEMLAGTSFSQRAVVVRTGRALRFEHERVYDVLADHTALLESVFSGVLLTTSGSKVSADPEPSGPDQRAVGPGK